MAKIEIYGVSDDLIEVDGDADGCDEFSATRVGYKRIVMLPSEDVFRLDYSKTRRGVWHIEHEHDSGKLHVQIVRAPEGDDPKPYSDTARVGGYIERVQCWETWPPSQAELRDVLGAHFECGVPRDWSVEKLQRILSAIEGR